MYDPERVAFATPHGTTKCFVATDRQDNPRYRAPTTEDLFDSMVRHGLHFDRSRQRGIVLQMITAVGNTHEEADALYERARTVLDEAARH